MNGVQHTLQREYWLGFDIATRTAGTYAFKFSVWRTLQIRAAALPDAITAAVEAVHKTIGLSAGMGVASKLFPFSTPFADAAEKAHAFMVRDGVMDHLHDENGFTHAGSTEQAGFVSAFQWSQQVDGFDPGFEDLRTADASG